MHLTSVDVLIIASFLFLLFWIVLEGWKAEVEADLSRCKCGQCLVHDAAKRQELDDKKAKVRASLAAKTGRCTDCNWFVRFDGSCVNPKCRRNAK